jgi:hypothetical protein
VSVSGPGAAWRALLQPQSRATSSVNISEEPTTNDSGLTLRPTRSHASPMLRRAARPNRPQKRFRPTWPSYSCRQGAFRWGPPSGDLVRSVGQDGDGRSCHVVHTWSSAASGAVTCPAPTDRDLPNLTQSQIQRMTTALPSMSPCRVPNSVHAGAEGTDLQPIDWKR